MTAAGQMRKRPARPRADDDSRQEPARRPTTMASFRVNPISVSETHAVGPDPRARLLIEGRAIGAGIAVDGAGGDQDVIVVEKVVHVDLRRPGVSSETPRVTDERADYRLGRVTEDRARGAERVGPL